VSVVAESVEWLGYGLNDRDSILFATAFTPALGPI